MGAFEKTSDDFQSNLTLSEATWLNTRKGKRFDSVAPSQDWLLLVSGYMTICWVVPGNPPTKIYGGLGSVPNNQNRNRLTATIFVSFGRGNMASGDRFYMLELRHRPAVYGDLGNILKIEGLVIGGEGARAALMLPDAPPFEQFMTNPPFSKFETHRLTMEEWTDFLARTDNPEILVMPAKAFHRKVRYEISGAVQQKVWVADGCKCMFCGVKMGLSPLSIDHWEPLESGGKNDTSNFLSACKNCNKSKGSMPARDWCNLRKLDYDFFVEYLRTRKLP